MAAERPQPIPFPTVVIVMGVSGSGKTTVGEALAHRLGWTFEEGDSLHPAANIAKMASGQPLTDEDRGPWLTAVKAFIDDTLQAGRSAVISCSALKRAYRDQLVAGRAQVRMVFLSGPPEVIGARVAHRRGHFMPPALLQSQLDALEPPAPDEHAIGIDIRAPVQQQVERVVRALEG
jgi:gluconokinase